ncbi:unnamed protein product [Soboliphyme baturini]|uniref:C2 NT-type domain-containing protein n=1 Tax=Soboliphyme baturini TaxID=241478 RepID=A0A183IHP1_9BILA|nr:unnamed protein product [Soboliphyme baturini]
MSSVWRKLQHQHKLATKFRFTAQFRELLLQCCQKWQPSNVSICWTHRKRRCSTKLRKWEPTITDPYSGLIIWPSKDAEILDIVTTLYRDTRRDTFDDKEWCFIVEEVTMTGKHKPIASVKINMRLFINEVPGVLTELKLRLKPLRDELEQCVLHLVLSCLVIKEGNALDEDMRSVASLISVQGLNQDTVENGVASDDISCKVATENLPEAKTISYKELMYATAPVEKPQSPSATPKVKRRSCCSHLLKPFLPFRMSL